MTGTPEDAERLWAEWFQREWDTCDIDDDAHQEMRRTTSESFIAGYAARPSVTVDEITELLAGHDDWRPHVGGLIECTCGSVMQPGPVAASTHRTHLASVVVAHITGEGT